MCVFLHKRNTKVRKILSESKIGTEINKCSLFTYFLTMIFNCIERNCMPVLLT